MRNSQLEMREAAMAEDNVKWKLTLISKPSLLAFISIESDFEINLRVI